MHAFLGIDTGTTSVSTALYDPRSGSVVSEASSAHNAYIESSGPVRSQDLDSVLCEVVRSIRCTLDGCVDPPDIAGISVTGQMHGFAFLDKGLRPVGGFVTWEDRRATEPGPDGTIWLQDYRNRFSGLLSADSGMSAAPGFASVNLHIVRLTGKIPEEARWIVSIQDWLASQLTGRDPLTDPSAAHSTGLFDPVHGCWQPELIRALGIEEMLPVVTAPGTEIGGLSLDIEGLSRGTPVYVGMGDNQASFLAAIGNPDDELLVTIGTGSQVSLLVNRFRPVPGLDVRPFGDERFLVVGAPLCGGRAYAMMHDFLKEIGDRIFDSRLDDAELYTRMQHIAEIDTTLRCDTRFSGTRTDPDMRGSFCRIDGDGFRPGAFIGSLIRGIASELEEMYRRMEAPRMRIVATGNGVRRNSLLVRALEDEFGLPVELSRFTEEAATGAALIAAVGAGWYADLRAAF